MAKAFKDFLEIVTLEDFNEFQTQKANEELAKHKDENGNIASQDLPSAIVNVSNMLAINLLAAYHVWVNED